MLTVHWRGSPQGLGTPAILSRRSQHQVFGRGLFRAGAPTDPSCNAYACRDWRIVREPANPSWHAPPLPMWYHSPGAITVLRSDALRKQLFGITETDRLPKTPTGRRLPDRFTNFGRMRGAHSWSGAHSVVVDAVFAKQEERAAIVDVARAQCPFCRPLFLVTDLATRQSRVDRRQNDASDATPRDSRAPGEIRHRLA